MGALFAGELAGSGQLIRLGNGIGQALTGSGAPLVIRPNDRRAGGLRHVAERGADGRYGLGERSGIPCALHKFSRIGASGASIGPGTVNTVGCSNNVGEQCGETAKSGHAGLLYFYWLRLATECRHDLAEG
jgi:hypothetical protein